MLLFVQVVARTRIHIEGDISYALLLADVVHLGAPSPSSLGLRSFRHLFNLNSYLTRIKGSCDMKCILNIIDLEVERYIVTIIAN
jgi:hypothetical protein